MTTRQFLLHNNKLIFWACLISSICLIVAGFIIEPPGQVHQSVLTAVGELLLFPTLATINHAIEKGSDVKFRKGDTEIELDVPDNPEQPQQP